jgi:hypothetical protein
VIAPARFGSASGNVLIAIDQDAVSGRLLAMDAKGKVQELATGLDPGINPIAIVEASPARRATGLPAAGLYIADTFTKSVFFTAAAGLKAYAGSVIVGTEQTAQFWIVRPKAAGGFETIAATTDLPVQRWNLERGWYVP